MDKMSDVPKPIWGSVKIGELFYGVARLDAPIDIIKTPEDGLRSSFASYLPDLSSIIDSVDLTWFSAVLVSSEPNRNNDLLTKEDLVKNYKTARNKRITSEHDEQGVIGHITHSYLLNSKLEKIEEDVALKEKEKIYIGIAGVIYNLSFPHEASDVMDAASKLNRKGVSFELIFPEAELHVGDKVYRKEDAKFDEIYGHWENTSLYENKTVVRRIINSILTGTGVVRNPAGKDSKILSAGTYGTICDAKSGCVNMFDLDRVMANEKAKAKEKSMGLDGKPDFEVTEFEIDGAEAQELLNEIFDEAVAEGLDDTEADAGARPSKKKTGHRSPPKGYPKSSDDYADPANHAFPIDTKERTSNALQRFFQKQNVSEYSSSEKLFMLRRIIQKANKFGIKVSDDIIKQTRSKVEKTTAQPGPKILDTEAGAKSGQSCGCQNQSGAAIVATPSINAENNSNPSIEGGKEDESMAELKEVEAKLEIATASLAKATETIRGLEEKLKASDVSLEKANKEAADKLKVEADKAKAAEDKIAGMELDAKALKRMGELTDVGVASEGDNRAKQEKLIRGMDDESFASYKESLVSIKSKALKTEDPAKVAEAAKKAAEAAEAEKNKAVPPADLGDGKSAIASMNASAPNAGADLREQYRKLG